MAHTLWHQGVEWAGKTFKPRGVTGAYMDAGLLGWPDVLGGVGSGLLDYAAQRQAANQWVPVGSPLPPPVNFNQSFNTYNASLANAVNQRMALRSLKANTALNQALLGGAPLTSTSARFSAPTTVPVASSRVTSPMPLVPTWRPGSGGGSAFPMPGAAGAALPLARMQLPTSAVVPSPVRAAPVDVRQPPSSRIADLPQWVRTSMHQANSAGTLEARAAAMKIYTDYHAGEWDRYMDPSDPWSTVQVAPGRYAKFNKETGQVEQFSDVESGIDSGQATMWRGTRGHTQARNDLFRLAPKIEAGPISASNRNGYTPTELREYKYAWNTAGRDVYETVITPEGTTETVKFEGDSPFEAGLIPPPDWTEAQARGTDSEGLPISAPKPPSADATKAIGFYDRMRPSIERAEAIEATPGFSMDLTTILTMNGDGKTRLGTILATMKRSTLTDDMQEYFVHLHNFTTAFLRKESGAAITPDEMRLGVTLYFPMPGEREQARAAKVQARRLLTNGMWQAGIPARQYYEYLEAEGLPSGMPTMPDGVGAATGNGTTDTDLPALPIATTTGDFEASDGTTIKVIQQNQAVITEDLSVPFPPIVE